MYFVIWRHNSHHHWRTAPEMFSTPETAREYIARNFGKTTTDRDYALVHGTLTMSVMAGERPRLDTLEVLRRHSIMHAPLEEKDQ